MQASVQNAITIPDMEGNVNSFSNALASMVIICSCEDDVIVTRCRLSEVKHKQWAGSGGWSGLMDNFFKPTVGWMESKLSCNLKIQDIVNQHCITYHINP